VTKSEGARFAGHSDLFAFGNGNHSALNGPKGISKETAMKAVFVSDAKNDFGLMIDASVRDPCKSRSMGVAWW
jgi:hypothetical protein